MKLASVQPEKVISGGVSSTHRFQIKASAKAFNVLIDGLYTNKIGAVVRELSTNAYEAHQMVNKEKEPFEVTLPSSMNDNFVIRDFGPGLSHNDVTNLYITLFDSTKEDNNEVGGAFGLGSKSPFAYTDQFTVTSYHKGKKRIYLVSKDEYGAPQISAAGEFDTEESGLEIKIAIKPQQKQGYGYNSYNTVSDTALFSQAAANTYKYFKTKPKIRGGYQFSLPPEPKVLVKGTGWAITDSRDAAVAIMGNIAYPLNGFTGNHKDLISHPGIQLYFNIGDLEPTPSRESLSYNKHTTAKIEQLLDTLIQEYSKNAQAEIDKCTCRFDAEIKFSELQSASRHIILRCNYQGKLLSGRINLPAKFEYIEGVLSKTYREHKNHYGENITPSALDKFIRLDTCTYSFQRFSNACYKYNNWHSNNSWNTYGIPDDDKKQEEFCKTFGIDASRITLLSNEPKPTKAATTTTTVSRAHKSKVFSFNYNQYNSFDCWTDAEVDLENDSGYYVVVFKNRVLIDGKEYDPYQFGCMIKEVFGKEVKFFGVKKIMKDDVGTGFKDLVAEAKIECQKLIDYNNECLDARTTQATLHQVKNLITFVNNSDSSHAKYVGSLKKTLDDLSTKSNDYLVHHGKMQSVNLIFENQHTGQVDNNVVKEVEDFNKKYPLINYINNISNPVVLKELVYYISNR